MYDDMIDISYPFDLSHKRMSNYDRCSQFMPFSALNGYKDAILETARLTDDKVFLDEEAREVLDNKIAFIISNPSSIISIKYYVPDIKKNGGSYNIISGIINKIDLYHNVIFISDKHISIENIIDIDSECFKD